MFKNYLKVAWRNLYKNRIFSMVNWTGLSISLACFLLIALFVLDELSYDKFNANASRIYRIDNQIKFGDFSYDGTEAPAIMGPVFAKDNPEIENYLRFKNNGSVIVRMGTENVEESNVIYADSSLFRVFTLPLIAGNPQTALKEAHSVVISESFSKKYFNSVDVVGKTMVVNEKNHYRVTGVIRDIPQQSHFHFNLIMAMSELSESRDDSWLTTNFQTYLLLKPGADVKTLVKRLNKSMTAYSSPQLKSILNMERDEFTKAGNYMRIDLMPLTSIHLHSNLSGELETNGNVEYVYIFSAIAIFILLMACVNFMNLSTAQSSNRAREIGVRKVLGGSKNQLVLQFLTESVLISFLSLVTAVGLSILLLPYLNSLTDKHISWLLLLEPAVMFGIIALIIIVGIIAGSYPAFFLSSFQPTKVLKSSIVAGFKGSLLRNILVVFQFSISMILMIGSTVIYEQINYIRNKNTGFNKEGVLILKNTGVLKDHVNAFKDAMLRIPGITNVTFTGFLPVSGARSESGIISTPSFDGKDFTLMQEWPVDESYIATLQLHLKLGRNFSPQLQSDSGAIIINEAAAKIFANSDPLNKKLYRIDDLASKKLSAYSVIGVIKDFNYNSLRELISPLILRLQPNLEKVAIKFESNDIPGMLSMIKNRWNEMVPSQPFNYSFLDEDFDQQYKADQRTGKIALLFSILAIMIACLGVFGMVSFAADRRGKEIAIRKVLGAAIPDIITLLSKNFFKLIVLSILIATPISWWVMKMWLNDFAYRTTISGWIFLITGLSALLIAFITTIFQTMRAALANPAMSVRNE